MSDVAKRNQLLDSLKVHVDKSKPNIGRITDLEDAKTEIRILNEQMGVLIDMVRLINNSCDR